ncbi:MAG: hypothetical protein V4664_03735 [Patescibacteria group bacterium]
MVMLTGGAQLAYAASLTNVYDAMTRLSVDAASDHSIQFRTSTGVASSQTMVVTFPSDFDGASDAQGALDFSDVDLFEDTTPDGVCDGSAETLVASGATSAQWNVAFSGTEGRVVTLTSGGASAIIAAASEVCIKIGENATGGAANSQYINPATNGSKVITLAAGSGADTGSVTVNVLTNDQVAVTATVAQSLTFSISDNTIEFGTLSASAAQYADDSAGNSSEVEAHNLIVGTNAANGYTMTINGSTLTSGANTIDAIGSSNTASSAGTEQFGIRMTATGGSGTVSAPYASSGFAFDSAALPDEVAAATGSSANTTYSARYLANIAAQTEAGAYSATLTYVAAANF